MVNLSLNELRAIAEIRVKECLEIAKSAFRSNSIEYESRGEIYRLKNILI